VDVVYPKKVRLSYQAFTPEKAVALVEALAKGEVYPENLLCRIDQEDILVEGEVRPYANPHPPNVGVETPRYEDLTPVLGPVVITPSVVAYGEKRCDVACTITKEKHHEP